MWNNPHLLVLDEPTNFLDRDSLGGLAVAIRDYKGGVIMISHNEEFVGALCPEQWHVADGRVAHKGHLAVSMDRFEDSRPGSSNVSSAVSSAVPSTVPSAAGTPVMSDAEGAKDDMKFRARKKKKMTKKEKKEQEVRRRLRHIEWLNSPKVRIQLPLFRNVIVEHTNVSRVHRTRPTQMTRPTSNMTYVLRDLVRCMIDLHWVAFV